MAKSRDLTRTEFTLDGNIAELSRLAEEVGRFCAANGIDGDAEFGLNVSLDELFTNAVRHGGCAGAAAAAAIALEYDGAAVRVEYRDRGTAFDPLSAPPPNLAAPLEERTSGGLGVHFVRQIMQGLQYDRSGEWNRLTMQLPVASAEQKG